MKSALVALALVAGLAFAGTATAAPTAKAIATTNTLDVGAAVGFIGSQSTTDEGLRIVGYQWNFGDGNAASGPRVEHRFERAGTFTVTLLIIDSAGQRASDTLTITVFAPAGPDVTHEPVKEAKAGQDVVLRGTIGQANRAREVSVGYDVGGVAGVAKATVEGDAWSATIPGAQVTADFTYSIVARDANGTAMVLPGVGKSYAVAVAGAIPPSPPAADSTATAAGHEDTAATPGVGLGVVLVALALLAVARRR